MKKIIALLVILCFVFSGTAVFAEETNNPDQDEMKQTREEYKLKFEELKQRNEELKGRMEALRVKNQEWQAIAAVLQPKLKEVMEGRLQNAQLETQIRETRIEIMEKLAALKEDPENLPEEKLAAIKESIKNIGEYAKEVKGTFGLKEAHDALRQAKEARDKDAVIAALDDIIAKQAQRKAALEKILGDLEGLLDTL